MPVEMIALQAITPNEIDAAVLLLENQMREHGIVTDADGYRRALSLLLSEPGCGFALVALAEGATVVGIACVSSLVSMEYGGTIGWLEELYVLPEWRGQGIGSALVTAVLDRARVLAWKAVDLEVEAEHARAAELYLRHGFKPHTRSRYYHSLGAPDRFHGSATQE